MLLVTVRLIFDSVFSSVTVAPDTTLPLGSVTVPRSEVDEVWEKTKRVNITKSVSRKAKGVRSFIGTSRMELSMVNFARQDSGCEPTNIRQHNTLYYRCKLVSQRPGLVQE